MRARAAFHPLTVALAAGIALAIGLGDPASAQTTGQRQPLTAVTTAVTTLPGDSPGVYDTPQQLAVTSKAIWIGQHRAGRVVRVDPATQQVVASIDVPVPGCEPGACAGLTDVVANERDVWVVNNQQAELVHIDARSNRVVGAVRTNGSVNYAPVLDGDSVWSTVSSSGDVVRISSRTHEIVQRVHVRNAQTWPLAIVGGNLWVGSSADGPGGTARPMLHRVDLDSGRITKTVRGVSGTAASVIDGDLWLSGCFWATRVPVPCPNVIRVDGHTGVRTGSVDVGARVSSTTPDDAGTLLVVVDQGPGRPFWMSVVDTKEQKVVASYDPPPATAPPGVAYGAGAFWVTNWTANTVSQIVLP
jgi:hypothetical protein